MVDDLKYVEEFSGQVVDFRDQWIDVEDLDGNVWSTESKYVEKE